MAMNKAGHSPLHAKEVVVGLGFRVLWVMVVMGPAAGLIWGHTHTWKVGGRAGQEHVYGIRLGLPEQAYLVTQDLGCQQHF
jgi:hypothetical protein